MSRLRIPPPLAAGATIGVTAPSSGVRDALRARYAFSEASVRARGFDVRAGGCLFSEGIVSAPAQARAAELMACLADRSIAAVIPPWGGELLIEILPLLDFDALARAEPKWFVGWSDCTTFMLPFLLRTGTLSLHGMNFMDAGFAPAPGAAAWWDVLKLPAGATFTQTALTHHQRTWKDYVHHPTLSTYALEEPTRWRMLGRERDVTVAGRMVGGCADVLCRLVGTPFGDVERFAAAHAPDGVIVFLENCEMSPADAARCWHQFVLAGWFDRATAVLIGRTNAKDTDDYTHHAAISDAFDALVARGVPVLYDVDIGHQPPQWLVVHGAAARLTYRVGGHATLAQSLA